MPFGFRIAPDTLPSGIFRAAGSRSALAVSGFHLRARLGFSIPVCSPGQRGVTPAFGYGPPHPSAEGTSTPMTHALPSAHYGQVRLLHRAHRRLRPPAFPTTSRPRRTGTAMKISRFPSKRLLRMPGSTTTRGQLVSCDIDTGCVAFCWTENISAPNLSYAAQYLACALPCERFTSALAGSPRITRGRCGSLRLHRDGLPPSASCRSPGAPVHPIIRRRRGGWINRPEAVLPPGSSLNSSQAKGDVFG